MLKDEIKELRQIFETFAMFEIQLSTHIFMRIFSSDTDKLWGKNAKD
jgi:hypothetical protein